jgi:hypothetical protein
MTNVGLIFIFSGASQCRIYRCWLLFSEGVQALCKRNAIGDAGAFRLFARYRLAALMDWAVLEEKKLTRWRLRPQEVSLFIPP